MHTSSNYDRRNQKFLNVLKKTLWPFLKKYFCLKISGLENIPPGKILIVSNHNIGALIESHSLLFALTQETNQKDIFGFTHPFIFRIPLSKQYFEYLGAVPATYEVAKDVFANNQSLLIFPGGNRQAVRSLWNYKENHFRWSHGWAKIALEQKVPVVPVTFRNSHFVNPVFICSKTLATILVIPRLLGVKWLPVSLSQILFTTLAAVLVHGLPWYAILLICLFVFHATVLIPLLPIPIKAKIHPAIDVNGLSQDQLEEQVAQIMDQIYNEPS